MGRLGGTRGSAKEVGGSGDRPENRQTAAAGNRSRRFSFSLAKLFGRQAFGRQVMAFAPRRCGNSGKNEGSSLSGEGKTAYAAKDGWKRIMAARDVLTKNQLSVLEKLEAASGPLSAYTLLDQLRERGFRAPLQVYRALDTLVKSGFVHRLESLNSFVACAEPHDHSHSMTAFAICDKCGQVTEFSDHDVGHRLDEWVRSTGFAAKKAVIEFRGTCAKCLAEAA
jgi:Fur family transcriptional regulator, zinc uptake regulator